MSALAPRSHQTPVNDSEWIEFPDRVEISPASVWALDDEDETTVQTARAATKRLKQVAPGTVKESVHEASPRVRILDESQVLPSEASFATIKMNQELESSVLDAHARLTASTFEEATANSANSRKRILDESDALPGEASFATVMLNEQSPDRAYSPLKEFFAKSNLNWRSLTVVTLLLVSIFAGITIFVWKIAEQSVLSSHQTENNAAETPRSQTEPTATHAELPTSKPPVPAAVSNRQTQVNEPMASAAPNVAKREAAVEVAPNKSPVASNSERSQKAASKEIKLTIPGKAPRPEAKSATRNSAAAGESGKRGLTTQQRRSNAKESEGSKRAARTESVGVNKPRPQTVEASRESSSISTDAPAERPKPASTSHTVTGGAQRPRTVTPKNP
ncbi:MAG: hypothetical protein ACREBG_22805 [Pyrinomonadaceae bacterium]